MLVECALIGGGDGVEARIARRLLSQ